MKELIAIIAILVFIMAGCAKKPKSPVEARFERYIQSENIKENTISIDSIVLVDSTAIINTLTQIDNLSDSLDNCILTGITAMADSKYIRNESRAIEAAKITLRYTDISNGGRNVKAKELKDKILAFIDENDENKCYQLEHKIYVHTSNGQDVYNARTLGYQDTIIIYKDENKAWTTKSTRLGTYLRDYMMETVASKEVLMDDINSFLNQ